MLSRNHIECANLDRYRQAGDRVQHEKNININNMELKFIANKVTSEINNEDEYYLIGFSDNGDEPNQYVILEKAMTFDEQDVELEMNTYYFEYSDQSNSGYGICKNVLLENNRVYFELKEKALDDIKSIEIIFEQEALTTDWTDFKNIFNAIFSEIV